MAGARRDAGVWTWAVALLAALVAGIGFPAAVHAQTQLPGITVTTPSPVTPKPAAGPPPATAPQPLSPGPRSARRHGPEISPDQGFAPVTVMTPDQLLSRPGATLGDALGTQPGISTTTFAPGAAGRSSAA